MVFRGGRGNGGDGLGSPGPWPVSPWGASALGADPVGGSPDDMQRYVAAEIDKWGKVAQFAGITPQ